MNKDSYGDQRKRADSTAISDGSKASQGRALSVKSFGSIGNKLSQKDLLKVEQKKNIKNKLRAALQRKDINRNSTCQLKLFIGQMNSLDIELGSSDLDVLRRAFVVKGSLDTGKDPESTYINYEKALKNLVPFIK